MKRIIAIWLAALMLAAQPIQAAVCVGFGQSGSTCANDCSGSYGYTALDGNVTTLLIYGMSLTKIDLTESCSGDDPLIYGSIYDPAQGSQCNIKFLIYDDDAGDHGGTAGEPYTLLYSGDSILINQTAASWFSNQSTVKCLSGSVWVGVIVSTTDGGSCSLQYTGGGAARTATNADYTPPAVWPHATDTDSTNKRTFYLSY